MQIVDDYIQQLQVCKYKIAPEWLERNEIIFTRPFIK